jgi:hypothetical protein
VTHRLRTIVAVPPMTAEEVGDELIIGCTGLRQPTVELHLWNSGAAQSDNTTMNTGAIFVMPAGVRITRIVTLTRQHSTNTTVTRTIQVRSHHPDNGSKYVSSNTTLHVSWNTSITRAGGVLTELINPVITSLSSQPAAGALVGIHITTASASLACGFCVTLEPV